MYVVIKVSGLIVTRSLSEIYFAFRFSRGLFGKIQPELFSPAPLFERSEAYLTPFSLHLLAKLPILDPESHIYTVC